MRKDVKAALDAIIDKVLAYKPEKPSSRKSKQSKRKRSGKKRAS